MGEAKVFPGVYRAVVTDTEDPQRRGRIQVEIPSLSEEERAWAPMLTQRRDSSFTAEVGDEVLVAFEAGDPASPFVLGILWSSSARPPTAKGS
jgi:uncharacterized protein involved in type VI secretion and phage assembly